MALDDCRFQGYARISQSSTAGNGFPFVATEKDTSMAFEGNDEALARQAQQGSREAFLTLYNKYLNKVYNRVRSRVPEEDIEDVVQDAFIAMMRSLSSFEQRSHFGTWLYTIVNRQIADYYRRRYRGTAGGEIKTVGLEDAERLPDSTPENRDNLDERVLVQGAMNKLPDHYRDVIYMRFADKLTFAEIAARRGQSLEAVKSLYRRAIQSIREQIGG
jgi:RNA polymerase sigma-70 factor, ECF subfamily